MKDIRENFKKFIGSYIKTDFKPVDYSRYSESELYRIFVQFRYFSFGKIYLIAIAYIRNDIEEIRKLMNFNEIASVPLLLRKGKHAQIYVSMLLNEKIDCNLEFIDEV